MLCSAKLSAADFSYVEIGSVQLQAKQSKVLKENMSAIGSACQINEKLTPLSLIPRQFEAFAGDDI